MAIRNPRTRRAFERSLAPSARSTRALVEGLRSRAETRGGVEAREWDELVRRMDDLTSANVGAQARKILADAWRDECAECGRTRHNLLCSRVAS